MTKEQRIVVEMRKSPNASIRAAAEELSKMKDWKAEELLAALYRAHAREISARLASIVQAKS